MEVLAEVVCSGFVESRHRGAAVRVDPDGSVAWSVGNPDTVLFPRSAIKPVQTLSMLRAGLTLEGRLLALSSSSHSGEQFHRDSVREILTLAGVEESMLQIPPCLPRDLDARREYLRSGGQPASICSECSGKHAAMLLTCAINDWPVDSYLAQEHPLQQEIYKTFSELARERPASVGIDGCGAPALATSLSNFARAIGAITSAPANSLEARLIEAIVASPEYVSGTTRDEMLLMRAFPGSIAKSGAEGVYVVGMPDGSVVALKIDDGADRARAVVMARALSLAGYQHPILDQEPQILGDVNQVGSIRAGF